jgi:hypothetical protein
MAATPISPIRTAIQTWRRSTPGHGAIAVAAARRVESPIAAIISPRVSKGARRWRRPINGRYGAALRSVDRTETVRRLRAGEAAVGQSRAGRERIDLHRSPPAALIDLAKWLDRKRRRGYALQTDSPQSAVSGTAWPLTTTGTSVDGAAGRVDDRLARWRCYSVGEAGCRSRISFDASCRMVIAKGRFSPSTIARGQNEA